MSINSRHFVANLFEDFEPSGSSSHRTLKRILINADVLKASKVFAGDVILLSEVDTIVDSAIFGVGVAWPSADIAQDCICVSASHLLSAGIQGGAKVRITLLSDKKTSPSLKNIKIAQYIHLSEILQQDPPSSNSGKRPDWLTLLVREFLVDFKYTHVGQKVQVVFEGRRRTFKVDHVSAEIPTGDDEIISRLGSLEIGSVPQLWTAGWDTQISLKQETDHDKSSIDLSPSYSTVGSALISTAHDGYASVGGLEKQIAQIRDLIEIPLTRPDLFRHFCLKPPKGILLHGPPGTGKTHLARAVVASTRSSVLVINGSELSSVYHGETEARLRDVFAEASRKSPCIVVLDEVDALCPKREDGAGGEVEKRVVATLLTILDGMGNESGRGDERVVVIATTNRPNAIDPALRRPGRFDREIEVGIPDADARYSILKVILAKTPHNVSDLELRDITSRAHGYVGADLSAVVREAGTLAIKRWISTPSSEAVSVQPALPVLTFSDLSAGLTLVQPSAMRSVFLETPAVRWADIGGQSYVQQKLRECVEWPLRHPEAFARLGVRAPKGVLLYGPPGCSKTLTARALATESGLNFIAVKGPELLNKFVGESERAVREIFHKARAASPSIVFFDEIDALGTTRSENGGGGDRHSGVLTTLLNEMDGVEDLVGVTIVAATNRPEDIDSALMRPGRLDRILYVGPPNRQGRVDILKIRTQKMAIGPDVDLEELSDMTDGCSGAELAALCQDAALITMAEDIESPFVSRSAFIKAAKSVRRQITPEIVKKYEQWREKCGLTST